MEHFQEGNTFYIEEEYELAVEVVAYSCFELLVLMILVLQAYTRATEAMVNHPQTYLYRGSALLKLKKTMEASKVWLSLSLKQTYVQCSIFMQDFEQCLQLQPDNEVALYRLG